MGAAGELQGGCNEQHRFRRFEPFHPVLGVAGQRGAAGFAFPDYDCSNPFAHSFTYGDNAEPDSSAFPDTDRDDTDAGFYLFTDAGTDACAFTQHDACPARAFFIHQLVADSGRHRRVGDDGNTGSDDSPQAKRLYLGTAD